jgi:hypothetical protein
MVQVHHGDGFRVHIWLNDHEPAHVHVYRAEAMAIIEITSLHVRAAYDMKPPDLRRAVEIVEQHQSWFLQRWSQIHGK